MYLEKIRFLRETSCKKVSPFSSSSSCPLEDNHHYQKDGGSFWMMINPFWGIFLPPVEKRDHFINGIRIQEPESGFYGNHVIGGFCCSHLLPQP